MRRIFFSAFLMLAYFSGVSYAQSEITFNINLKPQLEDSSFIPDRDVLRIVGDLRPINTPTPYYLVDSEPVDSIYSVTIRFSSRYRNQILTYNYEMTSNGIKLTELLPRSLQLQGREIDLDALYFNTFVW